MRTLVLILGTLLAVMIAGAFWFGQENKPLEATINMAEIFSADLEGYDRAYGPRPIEFPRDHGAHPNFKLEWWYYTGNLKTESGRRFGYQFTIFRNALAPIDSLSGSSSSTWRTNQLYFSHFTVSDIENEAFYAFERFSRGAAGLAGVQAAPFRAWVESWNVSQVGSSMPPMRIQASQDNVSIDVSMDLAKPIVLQGNDGYSPKGTTPGNASYYYSMPRLKTEGTVTINEEEFKVEGLSWMDREWSTGLLTEEQEGWDWFSIQLEEGRDIMYGVMRAKSDDVSPYSDGTLIARDGSKRQLERGEVVLDVLDTWESPRGGTYPSKWRMQLVSEGLDLYIEPYFNDQELNIATRYWEGAVRIEGTEDGVPVSGSGYVELVGYADGKTFANN